MRSPGSEVATIGVDFYAVRSHGEAAVSTTLEPGVQARRLLRAHRHGVLATHSKRFAGYPFGSVVPYMVEHDGSLLILISSIAEHTRNLAADARVSLTAFMTGQDVQAESRVTVIGRCERAEEHDATRDRYLRLFPRANGYLNLDFAFHRIKPLAVRFIGGFGAVHWVDWRLVVAPVDVALAESALVTRINTELVASLRAYCAQHSSKVPDNAIVVALDTDGLDVRADACLLRLEFPTPCDAPDEIYDSTVALLTESSL